MKRLIFSLLFLLMAAQAHAGGVTFIGGGVPSVACADSSCTGFLACQNFEGTGADNSETWSDEDSGDGVSDLDSVSPALRGTQSLKATANTGAASRDFSLGSDRSNLYGFFRFQRNTTSAGPLVELLKVYDSGYSVVYKLAMDDGNQLIMYTGSGSTGYNDAVNCPGGYPNISVDTTYYVWFDFASGSGTATGNLYLSTTRTKPASPNCTLSSQTANAARSVRLQASGGGQVYNFDQTLLKTSSFGDVCE